MWERIPLSSISKRMPLAKNRLSLRLLLVSGRPTIVSKDANQASTDQIFFRYRGGRLDVNGNTINVIKLITLTVGRDWLTMARMPLR